MNKEDPSSEDVISKGIEDFEEQRRVSRSDNPVS